MGGRASMQALRCTLAYLCVVPILQNPLTGGIDRVVALETFGHYSQLAPPGLATHRHVLIYPHRCSSICSDHRLQCHFTPSSTPHKAQSTQSAHGSPLSRVQTSPIYSSRPAQSVTMPAILESAVPHPPHLHLSTASPWSPYNSHCYGSSASSPTPMTPESLNTFVPRLHDSPLPSQEAVPSSNWFGTSVSAPDAQNEVRLHAHMPRCLC